MTLPGLPPGESIAQLLLLRLPVMMVMMMLMMMVLHCNACRCH